MADTVHISSVNDGAFEKAFGELPPWASEDTAESIEQHLKDSLGIQKASLAQLLKTAKHGGTALSEKEIRDVSDELGKLHKNIAVANVDEEKAKKLRKEKEKAEKESIFRGKRLETGGEKVQYILSRLAIAGTAVTGVFKEYIDTQDQMFRAGINVLGGTNATTDGFEALQTMVMQTGLRLETLKEISGKYSSSINATGMAKFARTVATSTTGLKTFGFSSEEGANLIGAMIESQSHYADLRHRSEVELAADAEKLGKNMSRLSMTLGISREQMIDNMKSTAKSTDSTLVALQYGEKAAANISALTMGIKDAGLKKMIEEMAAAPNYIFTQAFKDLNQVGLGAEAAELGRIIAAGRDIEDPLITLGRLEKAIQPLMSMSNRGTMVGSILGTQRAGENPSAEAAAALVGSLRNLNNTSAKLSERQMTDAMKTQSSVAAYQTQLQSLSASLEKAFKPTIAQLDMFTSGLEKANSVIEGSIKAVDSETRSWIGVTLAIAGLGVGLLGIVKAVDVFLSLFSKKSRRFSGVFDQIDADVDRSRRSRRRGRVPPRMPPGGRARSPPGGSNLGSIFKSGADLLSRGFSGLGKMLGTAGNWILSAGRSIFSTAGSIFSGSLSSIKTVLKDITGGLGSVMKSIGSLAVRYAAMAIGGAVIDSAAGALGVGGKEIDRAQDQKNWEQFGLLEKVESGFARSVETMGEWFALGNITNEAQAARIKAESEYLNNKNKKQDADGSNRSRPNQQKMSGVVTNESAGPPVVMSVPKNPKPSDINSLSAISTDTSRDPDTDILPSLKPASLQTSELDSKDQSSDINSTLVHQGMILNHVLESINRLVSLNADILRYTKMRV